MTESLLFSMPGTGIVAELAREQIARGLAVQVHPLGFAFVDLPIDREIATRLHVWIPSRFRSNSPTTIHNHYFASQLTVLVGEMFERRFIVQPDREDKALHRIAQVESDELNVATTLVPTTHLVQLTGGAQCRHACGAQYVVPAGTFHSASPGSDPCVTLFQHRRYSERRPSEAVLDVSLTERFKCPYRVGDREVVLRAINLIEERTQ